MTRKSVQIRPEAPTPRRGTRSSLSSAPKQDAAKRQQRSGGRAAIGAPHTELMPSRPTNYNNSADDEHGRLPVLVQGGSDRRRRATAPELHDLPDVHAERARSRKLSLGDTKAAREMKVSHSDNDNELLIEKSSYNLGLLTYRAVLCGEPMRGGVHRAEFTLLSGVADVVIGVGREHLDPLTTHSVLHTDDGWGLDVLNGDLVHGSGLDVQNTTWVSQQPEQGVGIYPRAREGDRIGLELNVDCGSLTVHHNDRFIGILVKRGLRVMDGLARDAGDGMMWVVELARKGQAVRVKLGPSTQATDDGIVGKRGETSRLAVRRVSAPSMVGAESMAKQGTARRQYKLRPEPLKSILKVRLPENQALNPPWMPGPKLVRAADLEVASVFQPGRRRRDDYVGEIGVIAETRLR